MGLRSRHITDWLTERLAASGAAGFVVGLSGGLDSAVVARLCQIAAPDRVVTLILPCHSEDADEADARLVAGQFDLPVKRVDLAPAYDRLVAELDDDFGRAAAGAGDPASDAHRARLPLANLKARLRMSALYFAANALGYLVAGTANRSERLLGYFTKNGDGASDVLPLGGLLKGEVRTLARELGVPDAILDKAPSAGLWPGQTDEAEMGFTYAELERYVTAGPDAVSPALVMRVERLIRSTEHKRALPAMPDDA